jgi:hypothetical protein
MVSKLFVFKVVAVFIALVLGLLLIEMFVRISNELHKNPTIFTNDKETGLSILLPNLNTDYYSEEGNTVVQLRSRSDGYVGEDVSTLKDSSTTRVAVLGDSFVQALQVDYDKNFVSLLEQKLNAGEKNGINWDVINFGTGGEGTGEQLIKYEHIVSRYDPDVILLMIYSDNLKLKRERPVLYELLIQGNRDDFFFSERENIVGVTNENLRSSWKRFFLSFQSLQMLHRIVRQNELISSLFIRIGIFADLPSVDLTLRDIYPFLDGKNSDGEEGTEVTVKMLKRLENMAKEDNRTLLIATIPSHWQTDEKYQTRILRENSLANLDLPREIVNNELDVPLLNLAPLIEGKLKEGGSEVYILGRGHFTEYGHELISEKLTKFVRDNIKALH